MTGANQTVSNLRIARKPSNNVLNQSIDDAELFLKTDNEMNDQIDQEALDTYLRIARKPSNNVLNQSKNHTELILKTDNEMNDQIDQEALDTYKTFTVKRVLCSYAIILPVFFFTIFFISTLEYLTGLIFFDMGINGVAAKNDSVSGISDHNFLEQFRISIFFGGFTSIVETAIFAVLNVLVFLTSLCLLIKTKMLNWKLLNYPFILVLTIALGFYECNVIMGFAEVTKDPKAYYDVFLFKSLFKYFLITYFISLLHWLLLNHDIRKLRDLFKF